MSFLLGALAVSGVIAILARIARGLFTLLRGGVDMVLARDLADVRAQRGDLTGIEEAAALRRNGRQLRTRALLVIAFWAGLLVVPFLTANATQILAAYSVLWLLPRRAGTGPRVHVGVMRR